MWNMSTKDGKYCSYLKWICSTMEKYFKSPDEYLRNYIVSRGLPLRGEK